MKRRAPRLRSPTLRGRRWACVAAILSAAGLAGPAQAESVEFDRDIRPILTASCIRCHGPKVQKSGFRLGDRTGAFRGGDSGPAIAAGDPASSLLIQLVKGADPERVMPPKGERLSPEAVALLERWVADGASWPKASPLDVVPPRSKHWAYQPLEVAKPPEVEDRFEVRNPIDRFVVARLDEQGMQPSPEADRPTLIRRLSYDLLGLPPAPEEVDAFVEDSSPDAYERLVGRLLADAAFGERWGRHWLDKARYADSDGYEKDNARPNAWRYRDWVIAAVNRDLPFDDFTVEQLAGDLLADDLLADDLLADDLLADDLLAGDAAKDVASEQEVAVGQVALDRHLATAFHRQTLTNTEGGTDQEEFRVAAIIDRVNTTGSIWLGLTVGCAQCHSHKYDPISQREFYQLFAFFDNADEARIQVPISVPAYVAYLEKKRLHDVKIAAAQATFDERKALAAEELPAWETEIRRKLADEDVVSFQPLEPEALSAESGEDLVSLGDGVYAVHESEDRERDKFVLVVRTETPNIEGFRLEALPPIGAESTKVPGFGVTDFRVYFYPQNTLDPSDMKPLELVEATSSHEAPDGGVELAIDGNPKTAWVMPPTEGSFPADFFFATPLEVDGLCYFSVVIDQQRRRAGPLRRFRLTTITGDTQALRVPLEYRQGVTKPMESRTAAEQDLVLTYFVTTHVPESAAAYQELQDVEAAAPKAPVLGVRVLTEREKERRTTRVLHRGDFLQPLQEVGPGALEALPPLVPRQPGGAPDRVDFARWLVSEENPLPPRVTVNHVWRNLFGRGIVPTVGDFGARGDAPSHPKLLDWLAREFVRQGWSRKTLIRTIVASRTYRQASVHRPEYVDSDPKNVRLYRQNRFRVGAEGIRDFALSVSGLLERRVGGPSVFPPMPPDVAAVSYANNFRWKDSDGGDRYRRGMYTFFKRTAPHPNLIAFDCPDSNTTCVERRVSNTPLQALALLNNEVFVEAARVLARRLLEAGLEHDDERLRRLYRLCLGRHPSAETLSELAALLAAAREWYSSHVADAEALVPSAYRSQSASIDDVAAWVATARVVLNLDAFITRE